MKINCPHCGQKLAVTDEMSGKIVQCPACDKGLTLSQTANELEVLSNTFEKMPVATSQDYLPCKFCGELIKNEAIKCRHCGEFLNSTISAQVNPQNNTPPPTSVHNIQVNVKNTNTNTNGCLGTGCGSGCGWLSIISVAVVIILIIAGQCSDKSPTVIPYHTVEKTTETKIAPVTVNQPTATIKDLKTISMPPVKLTQQQRRLKLMDEEPFKPAAIGDKVKFTIDEKTKITGKLVNVSDRGIKVEAAEGVTVLYRRDRINESDLVQFYRSDYDRYISTKLSNSVPAE